ncbi:hypothetical protein CEXT_732561 [Caerostris extrusa]|uniref:Uncharacterized protein n=1 Tax=Caerostris extrusa TaxID=172846 RepID=A0AAV4QZ75_CAEEX|nr:hypothetical protein CEXT_732561 [Caerostris extrusa]
MFWHKKKRYYHGFGLSFAASCDKAADKLAIKLPPPYSRVATARDMKSPLPRDTIAHYWHVLQLQALLIKLAPRTLPPAELITIRLTE